MPDRPTNGRGLAPLPTPQAKAAFIEKLLAPLPRGERHDVNEICAAREVREDRNRAWSHVLGLLDRAHRSLQLVDADRLRWIHDTIGTKRPPASLVEAERRCRAWQGEIVRLMAAIVELPATSRAQVLDKQKAFDRHTRGVSIDPKLRDRWKAAMAVELDRFPKQERPARKGAANA